MWNRYQVGICWELNPELWDNPGVDGEGDESGFKGDGQMSICGWFLWLIHVAVWRKPAKYCKAIILQSKKRGGNFFFLIESQGEEDMMSFSLWWTVSAKAQRKGDWLGNWHERFGLDTHTQKVLVVNIIKPLNYYNETLLHSFILDQNL